MTVRTDVHRPAEIMPCDYSYVLWYSTEAVGAFGQPEPPYNVNCELVVLHDKRPHMILVGGMATFCCPGGCPTKAHQPDGQCCVVGLTAIAKVKWATTGGQGKCTCCGAWYKHGEVWRHEPTGEHIHLGYVCCDKYGLTHDRSGWKAWHKQQTKFRAQAAKDKRFKTAAHKFLEGKDELKAALALGDANAGDARYESIHVDSEDHLGPRSVFDPGCPLCHGMEQEGRRQKYLPKVENDRIFAKVTLADFAAKLNKYGSLSDRQVAFALKLAHQATAQALPTPEEQHVSAPTGRVDFVGQVVSVKSHDSDWGTQYKMTVKVVTPAGAWLCWLTVPTGLFDDLAKLNLNVHDLKGKTVDVRATLTPGNESFFAFGKRPQGRLVEVVNA